MCDSDAAGSRPRQMSNVLALTARACAASGSLAPRGWRSATQACMTPSMREYSSNSPSIARAYLGPSSAWSCQ
jgi:hypothetical protein